MDHENLIVPTVSIYEVVKRIRRDTGEKDAVTALNAMVKGRVIELDLSLAMDASRHNLPMADSVIYATALRYGATLWTQDEDFETLPNVRFFAK
jgi:predicted nucleic acid-binding protein